MSLVLLTMAFFSSCMFMLFDCRILSVDCMNALSVCLLVKTEVQAVALGKQVVELGDRTTDSLNGALHQIDEHNFL
jgi:hypothetical protein